MSDHDEFYEELRDSLFFESPASLSKEAGEPPEKDNDGERFAAVEHRMDTLEHRLHRTLQCINRCQTDQANLRKELRGLIWNQETDRKRLDRLRKNLRLGLRVALGAVVLGWLPQLAKGGQNLLNGLGDFLQVEPALVAGAAVAVVLLDLVVRLGRRLVRCLTRHQEERAEEAVSDR